MIVLSAVSAFAGPRVAIELGEPHDAQRLEIETRLRAELALAGFEAVIAGTPEDAEARGLENGARRSGAFAAIAVVRHEGLGADVWVADRVTGKTVRRHVDFDAASPDAPAIFAIRAVELLHASLLELSEPHVSRGEMKAPPVVERWAFPDKVSPVAATREARFGVAIATGPGGVPATIAPALGIGWRPLPGWVGGFDLWGPGLATVSALEGEARLDQEMLTVWVRAEPFRSSGVVPFVKGGAGAYHLGARGTASAPFAGQAAQVWSAVALAGVGVRIGGLGPVSVNADLDAAFLAPRPGIEFGERAVAKTGRPMLVGQTWLGVEW